MLQITDKQNNKNVQPIHLEHSTYKFNTTNHTKTEAESSFRTKS